jgi:hypothetical protein
MADNYMKELVLARLSAMPPNVSFSIGSFGSFTPSDLMAEVKKGSEIGEATIKMQINFLRASTKVSQRIGCRAGEYE